MAVGSTLHVGVTGHRDLADPGAVALQVDHAIDRFVSDTGATDVVAVSSLAEGADRIVALRVLARPGGRLVVFLPLASVDYAADFTDAASQTEFVNLLASAESWTVVPPQESREAAYERAGLEVLAASDVLLALWDGAPGRGRGGTADLVAQARAKGRPVEIIDVARAAR